MGFNFRTPVSRIPYQVPGIASSFKTKCFHFLSTMNVRAVARSLSDAVLSICFNIDQTLKIDKFQL